ncbi:MAG: helicase RepA family protein [Chloroflexi bacterium]|nr:helicase RepA family protein [Chloroflexota bacterium]
MRGNHGSPVLILDAEGGLQRTWDRLARTMRGHNADPAIPLHFIPFAYLNLTRGDAESEYWSNVANSLGAKLIIIDALANVTRGADENNLLSIQPVFDTLRKVAKNTGAAVVVIHHTNKQGLYRGSSSMSASVDHLLLVESPPDDNLVSIRTFKARDLAPVLLTARAIFNNSPDVGAHDNAPLRYISLSLKPVTT